MKRKVNIFSRFFRLIFAMLIVYLIITGMEIKVVYNPEKPKSVAKSWVVKTVDFVKLVKPLF